MKVILVPAVLYALERQATVEIIFPYCSAVYALERKGAREEIQALPSHLHCTLWKSELHLRTWEEGIVAGRKKEFGFSFYLA